MGRRNFTHQGVEYDLAHLDSFLVLVGPKQDGYAAAKLRVTFSHHVFTKAWADGCDPYLSITEDGELRTFCFDRFERSKALRDIVEYHIRGRAYEDRDSKGNRNHLFYEQKEASQTPYAVYFKLDRSSKTDDVAGTLHIISAYEKLNLPPRKKLQAVTFRNLVDKRVGFKPQNGK